MSITFASGPEQAGRHGWGKIVGKWAQGDIGKGGTRGDQVRGTMLRGGVATCRRGAPFVITAEFASLACTCLLGGGDLPGWPKTTDAVHAPSHRPRVSKHRPVTSASIDGWLGRVGVRVKSPGLHELQAEAECSFPKAGVHGLSAYPRPAPECVPMASQAKR